MSSADGRMIWYSKLEHGVLSVRRLVVFDDGSAGVEVIFEEDPDA